MFSKHKPFTVDDLPENHPLKEAISVLMRHGFDVYMREPKDTWVIYENLGKLAYMQRGGYGGIDISTVHVPNQRSGTGYSMHRGLSVDQLTPEVLCSGFLYYPSWGNTKDVTKWRSFEHFRNSNPWNQGYQRVW